MLTNKTEAFGRLLTIMDELREKCPWDRKQTIETLRNMTIEETYELADAITEGDLKGLKEELGDLLLHIVFYARIASEKNAFDITDVLNSICEKLINRHPHIYSNVDANTEEQVKKNWEDIKLKEGKKSVLDGVPASLPAIIKAYRIQEKAAQVGFQWETTEQVWEKVKEETIELHNLVTVNDSTPQQPEKITEEFGDLLFALVNYARYIGIDPENAIELTNKKFIRRFQYIEEQARKTNQDLRKMTLEEMDALWDKAKELEKP